MAHMWKSRATGLFPLAAIGYGLRDIGPENPGVPIGSPVAGGNPTEQIQRKRPGSFDGMAPGVYFFTRMGELGITHLIQEIMSIRLAVFFLISLGSLAGSADRLAHRMHKGGAGIRSIAIPPGFANLPRLRKEE